MVDTLLGGDAIHKVLKLGTLVIPGIIALVFDLTAKTNFFVPAFIAGFLAMSGMIYHNINRARESD